jgi:hypothetical protein
MSQSTSRSRGEAGGSSQPDTACTRIGPNGSSWHSSRAVSRASLRAPTKCPPPPSAAAAPDQGVVVRWRDPSRWTPARTAAGVRNASALDQGLLWSSA